MGFRAPSAERVYRYLLRPDDRSLTDRFGWSVLLVGDYSDASREFLLKYCLDLCSRTADRARFVFFSEMGTAEFERLSRWTGGWGGGTLGAVLSTLSTRLDFRRERWDEVRPETFVPLPTESEILARLDHHQRELAAVPGAGEALRFAQRLGIGRHVPCLVVFTDTGERTAHVLPFDGRGVDEVYQRVRGWIDDYYEVNRAELEHWSKVEREIDRLAVALSRSLRVVREWPESQRHEWRALRRVTELAAAPPADLAAVEAALATYLPIEVVDALRTLRQRLWDLRGRGETRQAFADAAEALARTTDPRTIRALARSIPAAGMSASTRAVVAAASSAPARWREESVSLFSKRAFDRARSAWQGLATSRRGDGESSGDHKRRDYAAFRAALDVQPVDRPEAAVDAVLSSLAEHYGVPPTSAEWVECTADFRVELGTSLRRLHVLDGRALVGDNLPSGDDRPPTAAERQAAALHHRDLVCAALDAEVRALREVELDAASKAWFAETAKRLHADLERRALARTMPALADVSDAGKLAELAAALDDYDDAVRRITYPHRSDPEVFPVGTRGVASFVPPRGPCAATHLRVRSREALEAHRLALVERDDAERAGLAARPRFDVFLAHHSADKAAVAEVCEELRRRGIEPWLDDEQIRPGTWFQDGLQSAIRTVRAAAVFFGPNGFGRWQEAELHAFLERCVTDRVPVIPVLLPGVERVPERLLFLRQLNLVRFTNSVREEEPLRRLVWGVTGERSVPDSAGESGTDR